MSDDLHQGIDPENLTATTYILVTLPPTVDTPGHVSGDIKAAFKMLGVPDDPDATAKLEDLSRALGRAFKVALKYRAKIEVTVAAGPPPTATATIE